MGANVSLLKMYNFKVMMRNMRQTQIEEHPTKYLTSTLQKYQGHDISER